MSKDRDPQLSAATYGDYRVSFVSDPAPASAVGGDVLMFESHPDGSLRFFIADMAGSGQFGHDNWELVAPAVRRAWDDLCASESSATNVQQFGEAVNAVAFEANTSLCAAAGRLSSERLEWAGWGWGAHILASLAGVASPLGPVEEAYGLKLGWLSSDDFTEVDSAFVWREMSAPTQVVLFTDGILGDDHRDAASTWAWIEDINHQIAGISGDAALALLLERSELRGDDVTAAVVNPA